jgi:hypothetical protein
MWRKFLLTLAVSLSAVVLSAQDKSQPQKGQNDKDFSLKVETVEVQLPVSVLDKEGRPVDGLKQEHFQVFEDKVLQTIKTFRHEDIPLSLGLVIDNSGSMRNKRERVNSAALAFVRESNPDDETFIVNFDDSAYLEQDFTGSIGDLVTLTIPPTSNRTSPAALAIWWMPWTTSTRVERPHSTTPFTFQQITSSRERKIRRPSS